MIETILSIKFCLIIVFLIGLITGYQFIKALIKEDFYPIFKKFKTGLKENRVEIDKKLVDTGKFNHDISTMRDSIKTQKDDVTVAENNLRDIEHIYFKLSDTNNNMQNDIDDTNKILQSHKKEINFYQTLLNKNLEDNINSQSKTLEKKLSAINTEIDNNSNTIESLKRYIDSKSDELNTLKTKSLEKDDKILSLRNKISNKTIELVNENKIFGVELEIDDMKEKLKSYKTELLSLKSK